MKLKYKIAKLEDVEEKYRELYTARDGAFYLDAEGATEKGKLDEFRDNNIELNKRIEALTKQYEGIDLEHVKALLKAEASAKDKKLIDAGKIDELLEERTKAMRDDYEAKLKAATITTGNLSSQLEKVLIDNSISAEAIKAGVRETALEDVLLRGRSRFKLKEGVAVPMDANGKVVYGKDGTTPESMTEWLAGLATNAAHLFKPSTGGGADNKTNLPPGTKTMTRSQFNTLDPAGQHQFTVKDKGVLIDG